jgi:hypothetical protein
VLPSSYNLKIRFLHNDFEIRDYCYVLMPAIFFYVNHAFILSIYNLIFFLQMLLSGLFEPAIAMVASISGALWGIRIFFARFGANVSLLLNKGQNALVSSIHDVNGAKVRCRIIIVTSPNDWLLRGQQS